MNGYYQPIIAVLRQNGFYKIRSAKGSHEIWGNESMRTTVPLNCPSRHTANEVMKQLKIKHRF
jgi:predicted RNA binding protein YcfA (HicA-like mRNA interferase family)